jgi:hypothetical protein
MQAVKGAAAGAANVAQKAASGASYVAETVVGSGAAAVKALKEAQSPRGAELKRITTADVRDSGLIEQSSELSQKLKIEENAMEAQRLKSFKTRLSVMIHFYSKKADEPKRMLVDCLDDMRLTTFAEWAAICIVTAAGHRSLTLVLFGPISPVHAVRGSAQYGKKDGKTPAFELSYMSPASSLVPIKTHGDLATWIDACWCRLPLELYVHESGHDAKTPPDAAERLFDALDRDGNGHLDLHETLSATKLSVLRSSAAHPDVSSFFNKAFSLCDSDENLKIECARPPCHSATLLRRTPPCSAAVQRRRAAPPLGCWTQSSGVAANSAGQLVAVPCWQRPQVSSAQRRDDRAHARVCRACGASTAGRSSSPSSAKWTRPSRSR